MQVFAHAKIIQPALAQADIEPALPVVVQDEPVVQQVQPEPIVENIVEPISEPVPIEPEVLSEELPIDDLGNVKVIPLNKIEDNSQKSVIEPENEIMPIMENEMDTNILATAKEVSIKIENDTVSKVINYSQYVFMGALVLLVLLLLVNILVRISVQHKPVIVQTLILMIFVYGLMNVKFHFLENVVENILIM